MKFVAISDTHCRHHELRLPKGDVLLHAGDVCYKGNKEEVLDFLNWFSKQDFRYKIFIAGNHDFYLEKVKDEEFRSILPDNIVYLNDSGITIDGINIWGSPITPWFFNWAFNRYRGGDIKAHWDLIPNNTDVLITHGPVLGIHDVVINGKHVGCRDLLEKVKLVQPKVHVCGHIHESYGSTQKYGVKFMNASVLNETYELVNKPMAFTL